MECDVVVVGAGPAGGHTARLIAEHGYSVALLEEHREIGEPVQCSGLITPKVLEMEHVESTVLNPGIRGAHFFSPSGRKISVDGGGPRAVVVHRAMFDRAIVHNALRKGVRLFLGTQAVGVEPEEGGVTVQARQARSNLQFKTKIVVGCDGLRAGVARWFGLPTPPRVYPCFEAEMVGVDHDKDFVSVFTGSRFAPGFFAWIVPTEDDGAMVGVGIRSGNAKTYFERMLQEDPVAPFLRKAKPITYIAGAVPLGISKRTYAAHAMIVGDAASQVKATSGGGIYPGMKCGEAAAATALEALEANDFSAGMMANYQKRWMRDIGEELRKDYQIHKAFTHLSDVQLEELFRLLDNPELLDLFVHEGDIDFPSKAAFKALRMEPRLLKFAGPALRAFL